jgi:UDP-N-acetylglucosamine 2-epimerase (non-hydrolysing)
MLDDLLELFEIRPQFDLDIMTPDQTLTDITTRVLAGMEGVLKSSRPEVVLVHGDTTTSTAAALAAFYQQIPVGHVEAGLRTSDPWLPYPEEMNRRLTGTIASYNFSPTARARENLRKENVAEDQIIVTGNTVIDAFLQTAHREDLAKPPGWEKLDPNRPIIVVTAHRRENHEHMREMCEAMLDIVRLPMRPQILWPVHPSPRVRPVAYAVLGKEADVVLDDPLDYAQMVAAVRECTFVLTDSGGIQEEAPCLGKPVLVMRDETERPEGVDAGTLQLVGHQRGPLVQAATRLLTDRMHYERMARAVNPYGDGNASERIVQWLLARLRGGQYPTPFTVADSLREASR